MNAGFLFRALKLLSLASCLFSTSSLADPACKTGGIHIADAFVRANAVYALYIGDLNSYLASNRAHFAANGDAVRCAAALSRGFMSAALQLYDPIEVKQRELIDAKMRANGWNPGPQAPTASNIAFSTSMSLSRLARVLPAAAQGDYGPWNTPTNEIENMQLTAERMLPMLLQIPMVVEILKQLQPLMLEAAEWDRRFVYQASQRLAQMK